MAEALLAAHGVCKRYFRAGRSQARSFDAVAPTNLELVPGELVACMGRSGSGKTTLLNLLAGLLEPSEGSVTLGGQDLYALDDARLSRLRNERFGVVPQGQTALHSLTVIENVTLPCGLYGGADVETVAMSLLARMGIDDLADAYPSELSGGELRRMALARALAHGPEVVFADEPTSDLDDESTALVLGLLREVAEAGKVVFLVPHESDAARYAPRVRRKDAGILTEER